jgi:membrane-associated phospholipid phosphatase
MGGIRQEDVDDVVANGTYDPAGPSENHLTGLFWAYDGARLIGTPPRLYNQIVRQIAIGDGMTPQELAHTLALCNLAMADAGIVAWRAKYHYNVARPVHWIRNAAATPSDWRPYGAPRTNEKSFGLGQNRETTPSTQNLLGASAAPATAEVAAADPELERYRLGAFTPNFPAYPSGHATFGSACFRMLERIRETRPATAAEPDKINLRDPFVSDELNGVAIDNFKGERRDYVPRPYTSLAAMIADNNDSRLYLGVHWRFDSTNGSASGMAIADRMYDDFQQA